MKNSVSEIRFRFVISVVTACMVAVLFLEPALAQTDPMIGTWKLNLQRSTITAGPPPRSMTVVFMPVAGGLRAELEGLDAQGMPIRAAYIDICDGQTHPATGDPTIDSLSCRRPDPYTMEFTGMKAGRALNTAKLVGSSDGKTFTFTANGVNASGQQVSDVFFYDKQ